MHSSILPFMFALLSLAHGSRILAVLPITSKSHSLYSYSILRLLALRGHNVVVYSPYEPPSNVANLTHFKLEEEIPGLFTEWTFDQFREFFHESLFGANANEIFELGRKMSEATFSNEKLKDLLSSKQEFDLVILEATVSQEALLVFGHRFNAPVINLQAFTTWSIPNWVTGNPLSISTMPDVLAFSFSDKMSFTERFRNFISTVGNLLTYHLDHLPKSQQLVDRLYSVPGTPPLEELLANISLTLTNVHPLLEYPRAYAPNMVTVGGVHSSMHNTPLPQTIKKFMDEAKEGIIYFSLGTFIPDHLLPQKTIDALVGAFKKVNKKIIWKINRDSIPGLPSNVMLVKWAPQPAILAHPNCHLFITHGGLFSQLEAFSAGKPVIGIPFLTEQSYNIGLYKRLGVGTLLDFDSITERTVYEAISTILNNPSFRERAKAVSELYLEQALAASDKTVFWVEYVLRHNGAGHLKPASASMPWYQLALLDVLGALALSLLLLVYMLYKLFVCLFLPIFSSTKKEERRKKTD